MKRYVAVIEHTHSDNVSYGLKITEENTETVYQNLSDSKANVEQLCQNLQNSDISAVHINDIIRDFIVEEAYDRLLENSLQ